MSYYDEPYSEFVYFSEETKKLNEFDTTNLSYENILLIGTFATFWNLFEEKIFFYDLTRQNICLWAKQYGNEKLNKEFNTLIKMLREEARNFIGEKIGERTIVGEKHVRDFCFDYTDEDLDREKKINKELIDGEKLQKTLESNEKYVKDIVAFMNIYDYKNLPDLNNSKGERDLKGAFLFIQRIRNNLFHGKKSTSNIERQRELLKICTSIIMYVVNNSGDFLFLRKER